MKALNEMEYYLLLLITNNFRFNILSYIRSMLYIMKTKVMIRN